MDGWMGTVLRVDLTENKITRQRLDKSVAKDFIGGRGMNSLTLFKEVKPGIDPLGPENVICFSSGPLTGTPLSLTSRIEVSTLSPLSGILGDGNSGGDFPTFLRRAGYDQIVITGKASSPKYLWINNENVELRNASHLWGKTTWQTTDILKKTHGREVRVACIGQAGENLVRFASTMFDRHASAARGSGAVMGSKKLKAIAVRGSGQVKLAMPKEFRELACEDTELLLTDDLLHGVIAAYGTHMGMLWWSPGYRYFQKRFSADEIPEDLRPEGWKKFELKRYACYRCVLHCKDKYRIPAGKRAGEIGAGLEYETIYCLGTNCGIMDPIAIMEMGNLSDAYGMCTIPLGNAIAFAKELFHRGIITKKDTGGLSLEWDDAESQIELVHQVALREGFGNIVAEGMYSLAKITGKGAMDYCYHVKGLSRGLYPPGVFGLAHATATRGADHLRGRSWAYRKDDPEVLLNLKEINTLFNNAAENPGKWMIIAERAATLADTIGRCKGAVTSWICAAPLVWKYPLLGGVVRLLRAATGHDFDETTVQEVADRIYTLEKAFNARQGITREDDRLPQRPETQDTAQGQEELKKHLGMLDAYYEAHGYDRETGIPTRKTLEQLGLKFAADELETQGPYPKWEGPPLWPLDKYPQGGTRA
jgi:aldehyde:ferredoxin oxidoreductase